MLPKINHDREEGCWEYIEELTRNPDQVQQEVLQKILTQNAKTEYLSGFLNGSVDKSDFKNKVPIVEYEHVKPYIERIANGEASDIICGQPITDLLTSSGTSAGQPKMMPNTAEDMDRKLVFDRLLMPIVNRYIDGLDKGKGLYFMFVKPEIKTPSGLVATTVVTSFYKSSLYRNRKFDPYSSFTCPDDVFFCLDGDQSMYCQLLCGLVQRDEVNRVCAHFASAALRAIKFLEDHFKELCSNIRTGVLSDWITDPGCRNSVSLILGGKPNPELADLIEFECSDSKSWEGIVRKLWPNTKYIGAVITGSMAQYIPTLEFYGGGLPLVSTAYASSECFIGVNLESLSNPNDISYTILPDLAYFEFLPVANVATAASEAVDLANVKIGHLYELVVTTFTGLHRYRVGDILMATGFYNQAPKFKFVTRSNMVLSIDTEKTNEEDLLKAVTKAKGLIEPLGFLLTEYTSCADTSSIPGHYILYWELKTTKQDDDISKLIINCGSTLEKCCELVEESLDSVYRRCRKRDKSIGALEIRVVKHGTFDALMDISVSRGASTSQYKTPRCIKSAEALKIFDSATIGRFFSQKAPSWEHFGTVN